MFLFLGMDANSSDREISSMRESIRTFDFSPYKGAEMSRERFITTPFFGVLKDLVINRVLPDQECSKSFYPLRYHLEGGVDTVLDYCESLFFQMHRNSITNKFKEDFLNKLETHIYYADKPEYWAHF